MVIAVRIFIKSVLSALLKDFFGVIKLRRKRHVPFLLGIVPYFCENVNLRRPIYEKKYFFAVCPCLLGIACRSIFARSTAYRSRFRNIPAALIAIAYAAPTPFSGHVRYFLNHSVSLKRISLLEQLTFTSPPSEETTTLPFIASNPPSAVSE